MLLKFSGLVFFYSPTTCNALEGHFFNNIACAVLWIASALKQTDGSHALLPPHARSRVSSHAGEPQRHKAGVSSVPLVHVLGCGPKGQTTLKSLPRQLLHTHTRTGPGDRESARRSERLPGAGERSTALLVNLCDVLAAGARAQLPFFPSLLFLCFSGVGGTHGREVVE